MTRLITLIFASVLFIFEVSAQCWYFDDSGDELCITDPDNCTQASYPDGTTVPQFIEALTIDPDNPLMVWAADDGIVGTLNVDPASPNFGMFTPISSVPYHDTGYDLDGLAYDASTMTLWASIRQGGNDAIVQINLASGEVIGSPIATTAQDIDELAFAPPSCGISGMYASVYDGTQWRLATINTSTGAVSYIGTGFGITDAESITFSGSCELLVNNGPGVVYCVNLATGAVITPAKIDLDGSDVEGMSCEAAQSLFITLAVDLMAFDVDKMNQDRVMVSWQTASEVSSDHFIVERSLSGNSGSFQAVGKISAAGESHDVQSYHFTDVLDGQISDRIFYRLRSIDLDGSNQLSSIRMIQIEQHGEIAAYPNPANDYLTVDLGLANGGQVQLTNVLGAVVRSLTMDSNTYQVSVSDLPEGNYFLQLSTDDGSRRTQKISIQH